MLEMEFESGCLVLLSGDSEIIFAVSSAKLGDARNGV